ncbi:carbohydrate ABC transporter permease [Acholeplasma hippikon]
MRKGSIFTRLSYLIMGFGNLSRKQIGKGLVYLFTQISFLAFMIISPIIPADKNTPLGFKALVNLATLGTKEGTVWQLGDNSLYMLLYGVFTLALIFLFMIVYFHQVGSSYRVDQAVINGKKISSFKEDLFELTDSKFHVTLLAPAIMGVFILTIIPNVFMILVAFTNFDQEHQPPGQLFDWVGFANFASLFDGSSGLSGFWGVLGWTLIWAFFATFTNYIFGILLALLINNKLIKGQKFWRTVFVLTIAIPQFVSLLLIKYLFAEYGPINELLLNLGIITTRMNFLGNASNALIPKIMVIIINLWVGIPYTMLMTSGILMNVPTDLYEAAEIDGATKPQIFRKITLPYVIFVTTPYLITTFMGNITSFNIIFLLTGGGPNASAGSNPGDTDLLVTWLFRLTVDQSNYSLGAVISILTFIIMAIGTLISYRRSKAYKEEGAFQ